MADKDPSTRESRFYANHPVIFMLKLSTAILDEHAMQVLCKKKGE